MIKGTPAASFGTPKLYKFSYYPRNRRPILGVAPKVFYSERIIIVGTLKSNVRINVTPPVIGYVAIIPNDPVIPKDSERRPTHVRKHALDIVFNKFRLAMTPDSMQAQ